MVEISRRRKILLVLAIGIAVAAWWILVPPKAMREVRKPGDEQVLNAAVAVVFSANYDISFGGIEKLYHKVRQEDLATAEGSLPWAIAMH